MDHTENVRNVDKLRARLEDGLIAATPVPIGPDGRLHGAAHDAYLTFMAGQPLAGVAVWAHTGRGLLLDAPTAERVLVDWRAALLGRVVIGGRPRAGDHDAARQGRAPVYEHALGRRCIEQQAPPREIGRAHV